MRPHPLDPPAWVKLATILVALAYVGIVLIVPLAAVFSEAFDEGIETWKASIAEPDAQSAIWLTITVAAISVPLNLVFGIAASWAVAKHDFPG